MNQQKMGEHTPYYPLNADQCYRRYRRKDMGIRALSLVLLFLCTFFILMMEKDVSRWQPYLWILLAGTVSIFLETRLLAANNQELLGILHVDCTGVKAVQVSERLMHQVRQKRLRHFFALQAVNGCIALRDPEGIRHFLETIPYGEKWATIPELHRLNGWCAYYGILSNPQGIRRMRAEWTRIQEEENISPRHRIMVDAVGMNLELMEARMAGNWTRVQSICSRFLELDAYPSQWLTHQAIMGEALLHLGRREEALPLLQQVAQRGGDLACQKKSARLLEEMGR